MSVKRLGDRTFGLALGAVFGLIALFGWQITGRVPIWAASISAGLLGLALVAPGVLLPINRMWAWIGHRIGSVFNYLVLSVFFYAVVVPFGVFGRLFGMTSFQKRHDPGRESYWTAVERQTSPETYADMF